MEVTPEKRAMSLKILRMICSGKRKETDIPYPDDELVRRALNNSFHLATRGKTKRAAASAVFGTGSTVSSAICRRFGADPDEVVMG